MDLRRLYIHTHEPKAGVNADAAAVVYTVFHKCEQILNQQPPSPSPHPGFVCLSVLMPVSQTQMS